MQIKLQLRPEKPLTVPYNYYYQLESMLYRTLSVVNESDFWHDFGYGGEKKFKGFCFGSLKGSHRNDRKEKKLCFENDIFLEIRSPVFDFIDAIQRSIEIYPRLTLFDTTLDVVSASLQNRHLQSGQLFLNAVTPVVIRSTLSNGHTHYFSPDEDEYYVRICNNAVSKYESITGATAPDVLLRPAGDFRKTVTSYEGFIINGYTGTFEIDTSIKMAEFIYNSGLGEKNSGGFGFVEIEEQRD